MESVSAPSVSFSCSLLAEHVTSLENTMKNSQRKGGAILLWAKEEIISSLLKKDGTDAGPALYWLDAIKDMNDLHYLSWVTVQYAKPETQGKPLINQKMEELRRNVPAHEALNRLPHRLCSVVPVQDQPARMRAYQSPQAVPYFKM